MAGAMWVTLGISPVAAASILCQARAHLPSHRASLPVDKHQIGYSGMKLWMTCVALLCSSAWLEIEPTTYESQVWRITCCATVPSHQCCYVNEIVIWVDRQHTVTYCVVQMRRPRPTGIPRVRSIKPAAISVSLLFFAFLSVNTYSSAVKCSVCAFRRDNFRFVQFA